MRVNYITGIKSTNSTLLIRVKSVHDDRDAALAACRESTMVGLHAYPVNYRVNWDAPMRVPKRGDELQFVHDDDQWLHRVL